ncbi:hypothetical protein HK099_005345 [Clydaea vesicula]|uniref:Uncharacterized protein n=1 Tax=Clydaea vesicula TaxID=447962 RepID=A0AAD5U7V9_9FUNG|nr:hypothetical protein HK099_005345 [Clydaea vesicula]KAJ3384266.1 hypothetical protein HDU92_003654 [Lobulomyces angularis]
MSLINLIYDTNNQYNFDHHIDNQIEELPVYEQQPLFEEPPLYRSYGKPTSLYVLKNTQNRCDVIFKLEDKKTTAYYVRCNCCFRKDFFFTLHLSECTGFPTLDLKSNDNELTLSKFAESQPFTRLKSPTVNNTPNTQYNNNNIPNKSSRTFLDYKTGKTFTWSLKIKNPIKKLNSKTLQNEVFILKNERGEIVATFKELSFFEYLSGQNKYNEPLGKLEINTEVLYLSQLISLTLIGVLEEKRRNSLWKEDA